LLALAERQLEPDIDEAGRIIEGTSNIKLLHVEDRHLEPACRYSSESVRLSSNIETPFEIYYLLVSLVRRIAVYDCRRNPYPIRTADGSK
jgi:hypothetical protein